MLRTYAFMVFILLWGCESFSKLPPTTQEQKDTSRHTFVIDAFPTDSLKQLLGFEPYPFFERPFKGCYCAKSTQNTCNIWMALLNFILVTVPHPRTMIFITTI